MRRTASGWASRIGQAGAIAFGAALLGGANPAIAQPLAAPAAGATVADAATEAEALRLGLAGDTIGFAKGLAPLEQVSLVNGLGAFDTHSAADIGWFFRTATPVLAGDAAMPIVSFYNPLADAAVVTTWRRIDAHWWLTAVIRLNGPTLRGRASAPWFLGAGRSYAASLERQARDSLRAAAELTDAKLGVLPEATLEAFAARLFLAEHGLGAWIGEAGQVAATEKVRALLAAGRLGDVGPKPAAAASATRFGAAAEDVRRSLAPVAAFQRKDKGVTVAFASPLRPALLVFVDFTVGSQPAPAGVAAIDFASPAGRRS